MTTVSKDIFYTTIRDWAHVPFCQQDGWVEAQAENPRQTVYFLDSHIASVGFVKSCCGIKWLILEAPAIKDCHLTIAQREQFYRSIREQHYSIIEYNDRTPYSPDTEIAMRQAGFLRPVGSFSFQLSNYIDLTQPLAFNENWRRNLKKADSAELSLTHIPAINQTDIDDVWALYQQMSEHKRLALPFSKNYLTTILRDTHFRLYFVQHQQRRIAMMIVHTAGTHSGLLYAANNNEANDLHAGYWMYREILRDLAKDGFQTFDMEKLAPSTHSTNALFQFKQGIKGQLTSLNGEWQWSKRSWILFALYFLKKYRWKRPQA